MSQRRASSSVGATLMKAAYGVKVTAAPDDKYLIAYEDPLPGFHLLITGTSILEFFPFLARVPLWMPGTGFLHKLAYYRKATAIFRDMPWADARAAIVSCLMTMMTLLSTHATVTGCWRSTD